MVKYAFNWQHIEKTDVKRYYLSQFSASFIQNQQQRAGQVVMWSGETANQNWDCTVT